MDFEKLLEFNKILLAFREVERQIFVRNSDARENDAEHSYQLAVLGWYVASQIDHLDEVRVLKYGLAHDLVEVYAGDTDVFSKDADFHASKQEREAKAAEQLKKEFPEFAELHEILEEYEKKDNSESRFVYALDKLVPALNIYQDGGRTWRKRGITLGMIIEEKTKKISISPEVAQYFKEFVERLKNKEREIWRKGEESVTL